MTFFRYALLSGIPFSYGSTLLIHEWFNTKPNTTLLIVVLFILFIFAFETHVPLSLFFILNIYPFVIHFSNPHLSLIFHHILRIAFHYTYCACDIILESLEFPSVTAVHSLN